MSSFSQSSQAPTFNFSLMNQTLQDLKKDIGASPLTEIRKSYMIGLIESLEQYLPNLYILLPRVIEDNNES